MAEQKRGCLGRLFRIGLAGGLFIVLMGVLLRDKNRPPNEPTANSPIDAGGPGVDAETAAMIRKQSQQAGVIPGMLPVDVHGNLTNKGFTLKSHMGKLQCDWSCSRDLLTGFQTCTVYAPNPNCVGSISATVGFAEGFGDEERESATEFLPYIATLPYEGAEPEKAAQWVRDHIGENGVKTIIGGVQFEMLRGTGIALDMRRAPKTEGQASSEIQ
jgi:hypothetical protein